MTRVLIVEDEPAIAELIAMNLRHEGYEISVATDSHSASERVAEALPDLVLLDWMIPGESGVDLARRWRTQARTKQLPIIILTARVQESDKVAGLDAGADDYVTKPFRSGELMARIRAVLRRKLPEALEVPVVVGPLKLDPGIRRVFCADTEVRLGPTEFRLLRFLMTYPERVHTRAQLLDRVWGDHVFIEERTVDVHIKRLRHALTPAGCAEMVDTVRGAGYRLTATARSAA